MTRRQRRRCKQCVWNKLHECGEMFCMFPACIVFPVHNNAKADRAQPKKTGSAPVRIRTEYIPKA